MAWVPISLYLPQWVDSSGDPASGYVLKAYDTGTTTVTNMATDSTGGTTVSSITLDSNGNPSVSGNPVIPHIDQDIKLALYPSQAAADANTGAVWTIDSIYVLASNTQPGVIEIATDAEAKAVTATDRAVTPGNLAAVFAEPPALGSTTPAAVTGTTVEGTDTTDASSTTAAAMKTAGGLGVAKKLHVGDNVVMASGKFLDLEANGAALKRSATNNITAGTTQTQGGATALTTEVNRVTTVGTAGDGVKLPTAAAGKEVIVRNVGANNLQIWPSSGDRIDSGAADAVDSSVLAPNTSRHYACATVPLWETVT